MVSMNSEISRLLNKYSFDDNNQSRQVMPDNSVLNTLKNYGDSLRSQRQNAKDTSLSMKKLKYQFKDISSKIIRSKTSASAKQVVSQAKREVIRLKRERQKGDCDSEEIEAAIAHAKAMERVARKKVKHLEEEELAKACGGPCSDSMADKEADMEERLQNQMDKGQDYLSGFGGSKRISGITRQVQHNFYGSINYSESNSAVESALSIEANFEDTDSAIGESDVTLSMEALSSFYKQNQELSYEIFDEINESMKVLLEDLGLDDLLGSDSGGAVEMDPEDLKALKTRHRNKEMKSIVEADSKYLKSIFEHYNNLLGRGASGGVSSGGGITGAGGAGGGITGAGCAGGLDMLV